VIPRLVLARFLELFLNLFLCSSKTGADMKFTKKQWLKINRVYLQSYTETRP
jgi:hypothetical protein